MAQALSRFRMLDLSRQLPGPFCSMLLADLGMDVVVVAAPNDPLGAGIPLLGRNKRSVSLNLKSPEGREIFQRLARDADVVLEGGRPGGAKKLGVDYETLRALNPRLVYCSISGYARMGRIAPRRARLTISASRQDRRPACAAASPPSQVQIADTAGALMATAGIRRLLAREQTGKASRRRRHDGRRGRVAGHQRLQPAASGHAARRGETMLTASTRANVYEAKDGRWLTVGAPGAPLLAEPLPRDRLPDPSSAVAMAPPARRRSGACGLGSRKDHGRVGALLAKDVCVGPVASVAR
jgi:alpha-methylacyl-CoA racemase